MFELFTRAFVESFPIFMSVITIAGLAGVIKIIRTHSTQQSRKDRSIILGAGLVALFVGLLVFPIQSFQMLEAIKAAGDRQPSFVMGGFYISFVPMFYGLFWFLISLAGWLYYKRKATAD
jgi:protein-S-isoprenylcysteine O-methyltransferase Ste14